MKQFFPWFLVQRSKRFRESCLRQVM